MRRFLLLVSLALPLFSASPAFGDNFWSYWGDNKAELNGYALIQPRYGALRKGTAVLIFVTEDFSDSLRVKAEPGNHDRDDIVPVLKLNFSREFQTGIYHYNVLSSTFVRAATALPPPWPVVKTSLSVQEWCGHVYQQWIARAGELTGELHSYFDQEADQKLKLLLPASGILEDQIPVLVRGVGGNWMLPGETRAFPFLPSSLRARFQHRRQAWGEVKISRAAKPEVVQSALGRVAAITWTVAETGGPVTTWTVEAAPPHRILGWRSSDGEAGTLLGSARLKYWELNHVGNEKTLSMLGLRPPKAAASR
jgi:hypothetical protein